jgi:hypothetical protein
MRLRHRVHTAASPAQVWEVLGDPRRWPEFELSLRGVRGRPDRVQTGQRLIGLSRVALLGIPIDVVEATPPSRLVLLVHAVPGLREQVRFDVTPAARGGSDVTVSLVVDGLLGWPAVAPLFVSNALTVRLLASRTDRIARAARRAA